MRERLDKVLAQRGLVESRSSAQELIAAGLVLVNGGKITNSHLKVSQTDVLEVLGSRQFVSRAGSKLDTALDLFGVQVDNFVCADIGSSTGGFTDVLLKREAKKIYAIDVGSNQLHERLRNNERVILLEQTDIRSLQSFPEKIDLIVIDVSFIPLERVLEHIRTMNAAAPIVALVKPQFELQKEYIGKNGIVSFGRAFEALMTVVEHVEELGFKVQGICRSPILGGSGNAEFLIHITPCISK